MSTTQTSDCYVEEAIFIRHKGVRLKVLYCSILRVEACGSYCDFHTVTGQTITVIHTLTAIMDKLPSAIFIRIHRSHLVNIHHVDGLLGNMILLGDKRLPVSSTYYQRTAACFNLLDDTRTLFKYKRHREH